MQVTTGHTIRPGRTRNRHGMSKLPQAPPPPSIGHVAAALKKRIAKKPVVAVIGLGYVGLPLAVAFGESGASVIGIDVDAQRVTAVASGRSITEDITDDRVQALITSGHLRVSRHVRALKKADAIIICVPTPLGKSRQPDVSYIEAATKAVERVLRAGQLIVLESTTYPGTTQEILRPLLESRGLVVGRDFFLAFSPERIDPGSHTHRLETIAKVVGGITPNCLDLATTLYRRIVDKVVPVSTVETAEMVKVFENTFRAVNIALVNELAIMCRRLKISVWEVIDAAATKPFGFMPFYPGPGLGGHCLPSDPHYLSWRMRLDGYEPRFIGFADDINRHMPTYIVELVMNAFNDRERSLRGARMLVVGVAYKANVADTRDSPAFEIIETLQRKGASVDYYDPHVPMFSVRGTALRYVDLAEADLSEWDAILILTAHDGCDWKRIAREGALVIDTRNATEGSRDLGNVIRL
jgi:UDP-N-acetyl-D-glucosamine dehydrogenase